MKRLIGLVMLAGALFALGGCVYGPGYYQRPGVVYDDGSGSYDDDGAPGGYGYSYYPGPGYYDPWCCYGGPWFGLGFYGSYYYGGHYHHGPYGHSGWHGTSHSNSGHSGSSHGGSSHKP